jgi:hypothetical protein
MQHVYCEVYTSSALLLFLKLQVWNGPPNAQGSLPLKTVSLSPSPVATNSSGGNYYEIDREILLVAGPGRSLVVQAATTAIANPIDVSCALTGDLIPPQ